MWDMGKGKGHWVDGDEGEKRRVELGRKEEKWSAQRWAEQERKEPRQKMEWKR